MPSNPPTMRDTAFIWPPIGSASGDARAAMAAELRSMEYDVRECPPSISTADLPAGSLVLVDLADPVPEIYLGLGELIGVRSQASAALVAAAVGAFERPPGSAEWLIPYRRYDLADPESIRSAVRAAVAEAEQMAPARVDAAGRNAIQMKVPQSVRNRIGDPLVAMATALYIMHIGRITEGQLAASIGFPPFPTITRVVPLMLELFDVQSLDDPDSVPGDLLDALEQRLELVNTRPEDASFSAGLFHRPNVGAPRTEAQTAALLDTLWPLATAVDEVQDLPYWASGLTAIGRIARLVVSQVLPSDLGTMDRLEKHDPRLQMIATLGGALFLRHSIEILASTDSSSSSSYTRLGLHLAELTDRWGNRMGIMRALESEGLATYVDGLKTFAMQDGALFMLEHPFHFRVLLEVLSGENRRYPAEPALNAEALSRVWGRDDFFETFCWSRDQLPVVVNLISEKSRARAFVQHYAAYGRTPLTSSFAHLSYETRSVIPPASQIGWPEAFHRNRDVAIRNEPNTVAHVRAVAQRQLCLGRIWRGEPDEDDLRVIAGELAGWDGAPVTDGNLADRIWNTDTWLGHGLVVDTLAEIRTGAWLLEALRLRLRSTPLPADWDEEDPAELTDHTVKEIKELCCVLATVMRFAADYGDGEGDGLTGVKASLTTLVAVPWFVQMGTDLGQRLGTFADMIEAGGRRLAGEVVAAAEELARWDAKFGTDYAT